MKFLVLLALAGLVSCNAETRQQTGKQPSGDSLIVTVNNSMGRARKNVIAFVGKEELGSAFTPGSFIVVGQDGEIPAQYNKRDKEGIVFVIGELAAGASADYIVRFNAVGIQPRAYKKRTQAELSVKKGGKFVDGKYIGGEFENVDWLRVPDGHTDHNFYIRYNGPGWESEKIGYRLYLDWRGVTDIFGKKTNDMVLQHVGLDGFRSFHRPASWGMDVLQAGGSLGIGSLGIFHEGKAIRLEKTDSIIAQVLENGPVYSAIQTNYYGWKISGQSVDIQSRISIHAGSRLTHHEVTIEGTLDNLCTGIGKNKKAQLYSSKGNKWQWGYLATYGDQSLNNDKIGMAVLFAPESSIEFAGDEHNHVVKLKPYSGHLEYYFLAAWELEPNGITDKESFMDYLERTAEDLANPVTVSVQR